MLQSTVDKPEETDSVIIKPDSTVWDTINYMVYAMMMSRKETG